MSVMITPVLSPGAEDMYRLRRSGIMSHADHTKKTYQKKDACYVTNIIRTEIIKIANRYASIVRIT